MIDINKYGRKIIEFLDTYRGAKIYEVNPVNQSEGQKIEFKVKAEGVLPDTDNIKVDFIEEAGIREQAVKAVKLKIDHYLDKQGVKQFIPDHTNQ